MKEKEKNYTTLTKMSLQMVQKRQTKTGKPLSVLQETLADLVNIMMNDISYPYFDNVCKSFDLLEQDGNFFVRIYRPWKNKKMLRPVYPIPGTKAA